MPVFENTEAAVAFVICIWIRKQNIFFFDAFEIWSVLESNIRMPALIRLIAHFVNDSNVGA